MMGSEASPPRAKAWGMLGNVSCSWYFSWEMTWELQGSVWESNRSFEPILCVAYQLLGLSVVTPPVPSPATQAAWAENCALSRGLDSQ